VKLTLPFTFIILIYNKLDEEIQDTNIQDRIEPTEGVKENVKGHCDKCKINPCMCPYKPPM
jgi:hypothetical protein